MMLETEPLAKLELEGIVVSDDGQMTNPSQPCFSVTPTSDQTNIAVGSYVTVIFGTEVFDIGNNFASNIFTAPITGKYQLNTSIRLEEVDADGGGTFRVVINTSNRTYQGIADLSPMGADTDFWSFSLSALADMDANDTAWITIRQATGTQKLDVGIESSFSGVLIC